ncbi:hypothetical protein NUSPORA_00900 [Nucleospora cyclopteri]
MILKFVLIPIIVTTNNSLNYDLSHTSFLKEDSNIEFSQEYPSELNSPELDTTTRTFYELSNNTILPPDSSEKNYGLPLKGFNLSTLKINNDVFFGWDSTDNVKKINNLNKTFCEESLDSSMEKNIKSENLNKSINANKKMQEKTITISPDVELLNQKSIKGQEKVILENTQNYEKIRLLPTIILQPQLNKLNKKTPHTLKSLQKNIKPIPKCIKLSILQISLINKSELDKPKFRSITNKLHLLLRKKINLRQHFKLKKTQNSIKSIPTKSVLSSGTPINYSQKPRSKFQHFQKLEIQEYDEKNNQSNTNCSYIEKNMNENTFVSIDNKLLNLHLPIFNSNSIYDYNVQKNILSNGNTMQTDKLPEASFLNNYKEKLNTTVDSYSNQKEFISNMLINNDVYKSDQKKFSQTQNVFLNTEKITFQSVQLDTDYGSNEEQKTIIEDSFLIEKTHLKPSQNPTLNNPNDNEDFKNNKNCKEKIVDLDDKNQNYIFLGSLSVRNDNDNEISDSNSSEIVEYESFEPSICEISTPKLYRTQKCIYCHRNANEVKLFNTYIDYLDIKHLQMKESINYVSKFPESFSFSHGWHKYRLSFRILNKNQFKPYILQNICKEYCLESYFLLILNLIKINTYSEKNRFVSTELCFHICCHHFCSKWNLGRKNNLQTKNNNIFSKFITNRNYNKLYKTKEYWFKKSELIFKKAEKRALEELGITSSTFTPFHLYNYLLILPFKNSNTVAFVCYVYHVSKKSEIDFNLKKISKEKKELIVQRRRILEKISQKYFKYKNNAKQIIFKEFKHLKPKNI